ncbi:MAG: helix-turn-helix domain-containing protein [Actinomycetota bacterium]|nr:helix-turn-helix domain-containing protein [Actinomycetota bacterium]
MGFDAAREEYRLAIVRRALARRAQLGDVVVSNILAELPEYANGRSVGELEDIRAGILQSADCCLTTLEQGRRVQEEERDALRRTGAQRARQGIPKAAVLASVKIAVRVGRSFLMTCTDVGDDPRALMAAFREITAHLDQFEDETCAALEEGHDEAWRHVLSAVDRGEALLVDRLLERRFASDEEVLAHAAEVGLSRHRPAYVAVVTAVTDVEERRLRQTASDVRPLGMLAVGPLRLAYRTHLPIVLQPRDSAHWAQIEARLAQAGVRNGTTIVWGERTGSLTELAPVYRSLREDLPYVPAATRRPGAMPGIIPRFHRVTCAGTPAERVELMAAVLRPLLSLPRREREELLEALDVLYETGSSTAALARHLHVHKNTAANRLRRVQEVVGLDVRRPAERLLLEAALRMHSVTPLDGPHEHPEWHPAMTG